MGERVGWPGVCIGEAESAGEYCTYLCLREECKLTKERSQERLIFQIN